MLLFSEFIQQLTIIFLKRRLIKFYLILVQRMVTKNCKAYEKTKCLILPLMPSSPHPTLPRCYLQL